MSETVKFIITIIISSIGVLVPVISYFIMTGKYKEKIANNEKNITEIKNDMKSLNNDIKSLNNKMGDIPWKILEAIGTILGSKEIKVASFVQSNSPISLSEKGNNVAKEINADKIIEHHKDDLIKKVRNKNPKTAYEKQKYAQDTTIPFKRLSYVTKLD